MGLPSKKEKREEVTSTVAESFQRMVFGFIPGGHVIDEFLNFRNNLIQKRIINFSSSVKKALEEIKGCKIDANNFTNEEFIDVFELIINKIKNTNSEFKLERFKNILVKQIVAPSDLFTTLRFAEMLSDMNDIHIVILDKLDNFSDLPYISQFSTLLFDGSDRRLLRDITNIEVEISGNKLFLDKSEIEFYGNQLVSMGLVTKKSRYKSKKGIGGGVSAIEYHLVSGTGKRFLEFIKAS